MNRRRFAAAVSTALLVPSVLPSRLAWSAQPATPESDVPDVPMYRGDPAHTGHMPGPAPQGEPRLLWQLPTGGNSLRSSPVIAADLVYVTTDDGILHALDLLTGIERWQADILGAYGNSAPSSLEESTPAVAGGVVYVSGWPDLLALDAATGAEVWRLANEGGGSPTVLDGVVYVRKGSTLSAIDGATGEIAWRYSGSGLFPGSADPAVAGGVVYVGVGQVLHAVDAATGQGIWQFEVGFDLYSSPAVVDGRVFFGSGNLSGGQQEPMGHVHALDAASGVEIWRHSEGGPFFPSPAVVDGAVCIGGGLPVLGGEPVGVFLALDAVDGSIRWKADTGQITSSAAVVDGVVYTGAEVEPCTTGSVVRGFDAASGNEVWRAELWSSFELRASGFSSPAIAGGILVVGGGTTPALYALGGE